MGGHMESRENKKKGISLIVLIITIIVVIILAGAVILSLSKNNPVNTANQAVFKSNVDSYKNELQLYITDQFSKGNGTYDSTKLNVTGDAVGSIIKSMKPADYGKFEIEKGVLVYSKTEKTDEYSWAQAMGILKSENPSESTSALWTFDSATGTISGYKGDLTGKTTITIPSKVDGVQVKIIKGAGSFTSFLSNMSTNTTLKDIIISTGIETIGSGAFYNCKSVTNVVIPDSVKYIKSYSFAYCTSLINIDIPSSVIEIDSTVAFDLCDKLTNINVNVNNNSYSSLDGVLYNKNKTIIVHYPRAKTQTSYTVSNTVTSIGDYAFSRCFNLTSITMPNSVTSIRKKAFADCINLTGITIPNNVTEILVQSFEDCPKLTSIAIPSSVTSIDSWAFINCTGLAGINVDVNNFTYSSIDGVLFSKDKTILKKYPEGKTQTSYSVPSSVTSIESDTFINCFSLTNIIINKSQDSISESPWSAPSATVTWNG
jgi:uncharacterized protein YpmB